MSIPTFGSDRRLQESSLDLKLCIQSSRSPGCSNATNPPEDPLLRLPIIHQHHHPHLFYPDEASLTPNRQSEELHFGTAVDHVNNPSMRRAHRGYAHMEHQAHYRLPLLPMEQNGNEFSAQRQLQQYLFTQTTANNNVNETNDLLRYASYRQNQDAHLRVPLPLSQRTFASDLKDAKLTQQKQLDHFISSVLPSQHPFTSDLEDHELIQQRQLEHFILPRASASNNVNNTTCVLLRHAFDRQAQDAQCNQLLRNKLTEIIHSSSLNPLQQVQHQNYRGNIFTSAASPSAAIANSQLLCGITAPMRHPPAAPLRRRAPEFSTAGLASSRNRAEEAVQYTPRICNDVSEAKVVPIDVSDKRTTKNVVSILTALGNRTRVTAEPYVDVSEMAQDICSRPPIRGGVINRFPEKLYEMLTTVEAEGKTHIISFSPHGRAFAIHDPVRFETEILPRFLPEQGKLFSFVRQLNLYGFIRINYGPDSGGYYHELFLKGQPCLSHFMRRVGVSKNAGGKTMKKKKSTQPRRHQPNFYDMKLVLPASPAL
jgi:hypothetical protein